MDALLRQRKAIGWAAVGLLAALTIGGIAIFSWRTGPTGQLSSIAVLPFANLTSEPDSEYFSDGLTEELINALTKVNGLRVVARTSAFQFKSKAHDVRAIGKQLNVATVLEGSVRKSGNRVRIASQLINVADGYHLWSETYDKEMNDVLDVQAEISRAVVAALRVKLAAGGSDRLFKPATENREAYNLYLKGRFYWNKRTLEGARKGVEYFEQAIAKDPGYALAYVGLAHTYGWLGHRGIFPPKEALARNGAAVRKALELDDTLAEAHAALGALKANFEWDWVGAEREFRRALEASGKIHTKVLKIYGTRDANMFPSLHIDYVQKVVDQGRSDLIRNYMIPGLGHTNATVLETFRDAGGTTVSLGRKLDQPGIALFELGWPAPLSGRRFVGDD